jgi:deoxyribodipyrimidine photo-lyase
MIHDARVHPLNDDDVDRAGAYVLYWMQQSQRAHMNHALEYAVRLANAMKLPVAVCFGLTDGYPEANERHYAFMLEGLREVAAALRGRRIGFVARRGSPPDVAVALAADAAMVVCDRGYLRHQRAWRDQLADHAGRRVVEVETDVVVPVEAVSDKVEFAARTLRPKITRLIDHYLEPLAEHEVAKSAARLDLAGDVDVTDVDGTLAALKLDRSVRRARAFVGGRANADAYLGMFIAAKLGAYDAARNDPARSATSTLSAYLHFGQIAPLEIALRVRAAAANGVASRANCDAYLEELIVRRELACNYCQYSPKYDQYDGLPEWARRTLAEHRNDARPHVYSREQLEAADTHDPHWNAAQREMNKTGFMHNYMRMYWGKRILEWSLTPQDGYATTLYLNNRFFLCGRDPNAYANVGWVYGLHDRPWGPERPIFGKVRYMNAAGLERKFDMDAYARRVDAM